MMRASWFMVYAKVFRRCYKTLDAEIKATSEDYTTFKIKVKC